MRQKKTLITILLVFIILVEVSFKVNALSDKKQEKLRKVNQNENIVLLGDSITDYYKTEVIFDDLPVINSGISGNTTEHILQDMEKRVYRYNPTKVVIMIGVNDIHIKSDEPEDVRVGSTFENICKIVENIRKNRPKCEIYLVSILPVNTYLPGPKTRTNEDIDKINSKLKENFVNKEMVTYLDINDKFKDGEGQLKEEFTYDGLHLNDFGYTKYTEIIMKYIY